MHVIKNKKALIAFSFGMLACFSVSGNSYTKFENEDNSYVVVAGAVRHNFINSGHVKRNCGSKKPCRYENAKHLKDAKIDKLWIYNKKNPYYSYDSAHAVINEKSTAFDEKDVYCLNKGSSHTDKYKVLRFNRHIVGVSEASKRSGKIVCKNLGVELPASIYGDAGDIMPLFIK